MMMDEDAAADAADDDFMRSLNARVQQVQQQETRLPIVTIDTILPRQVIKLEIANDPTFQQLIESLIRQERPVMGMVGKVRLAPTGEMTPLQNGCEVEIIGNPQIITDGSNANLLQDDNDISVVRVTLRATRRFRMLDEFYQAPQGWAEAKVQYLDSAQEQADEELESPQGAMAVYRAIEVAQQFTTPNMNMPGGMSLVDRWIELARMNERAPGQIDELLLDLGPIPPEDEPSERAFWVAALINPLPGMGVAMEIRPLLLMARSAEERVGIALKGILESIKHMDGSAPLF
jgi:Lon protease-like protein